MCTCYRTKWAHANRLSIWSPLFKLNFCSPSDKVPDTDNTSVRVFVKYVGDAFEPLTVLRGLVVVGPVGAGIQLVTRGLRKQSPFISRR